MHVQVNIQQPHPVFLGDNIKQLVCGRPFTTASRTDQFEHPISLCHVGRDPFYSFED
jgi:hypothetical protein